MSSLQSMMFVMKMKGNESEGRSSDQEVKGVFQIYINVGESPSGNEMNNQRTIEKRARICLKNEKKLRKKTMCHENGFGNPCAGSESYCSAVSVHEKPCRGPV